MPYPYLDLSLVLMWEAAAEHDDVSRVARSRKGFVWQYRQASGDPELLTPAWERKREGFIARHMGQVQARGESLWTDRGLPTRRHLALIMWAYSPDRARLARLTRRILATIETGGPTQ